jgi:hypothetical protein
VCDDSTVTLSIVSIAVAALAAVFTGIVASYERKQWASAREASRRATINTELQQRTGQWYLIISNSGPATASQVVVELAESDTSSAQLDLIDDIFPLTLVPLQRFSLPIIPGLRHPRHFLLRLHICWSDLTGEHSAEHPLAATAEGSTD